jgi:hypothetical protein
MLHKAKQAIEKTIKATNHPALYRKLAQQALKVDKVRGTEMAELVISLASDSNVRELMFRFVDSERYDDPEDGINEVAQLVGTIMVAARSHARA